MRRPLCETRLAIILIAALPCFVSSFLIVYSPVHSQPSVAGVGDNWRTIRKRFLHSTPGDDDAERLREQAQKLRAEIDSFEQSKLSAEQQEHRRQEEAQAAVEAKRERYSAMVPILKPDGSVVEERCDFAPRWKKENASYIKVVESLLPIGVILGESDLFRGAISVDEIGEESNGGKAGLQVGDLLRAFTACRMEMDTPTWQLMAGGIGRPKTVRFMYSADNRPFEEVMEAIASNRMDPEARPVLIVVERKEEYR